MLAPSIRFPILALAFVGSLVLLYAAQVAVRHVHAQGDAAPTCATGVAVPDAANNPGLVSDCEALLASRDTLAGSGTLNWSADTPVWEWEDVGLGGKPLRIIGLYVHDKGLSGKVPPELGSLSNLQTLSFFRNELKGDIPASLGNLANLETLDLRENQLAGEIPASLGNLLNLEILDLADNKLTGEIPSELGNLANLEALYLGLNQLTGTIPASLGNLLNLRLLSLDMNGLTGEIPTDLGSLSKLERLSLNGNN